MNMLRLTTCVAMALAASGCASLKHTIEPERILPLPGETVPVPQSLKDDNGVKCGLAPATTIDGSIPAEIERFTQAMYCAYSGDASQQRPWIRRFVENGVALNPITESMTDVGSKC
jgi:hypothetical protein